MPPISSHPTSTALMKGFSWQTRTAEFGPIQYIFFKLAIPDIWNLSRAPRLGGLNCMEGTEKFCDFFLQTIEHGHKSARAQVRTCIHFVQMTRNPNNSKFSTYRNFPRHFDFNSLRHCRILRYETVDIPTSEVQAQWRWNEPRFFQILDTSTLFCCPLDSSLISIPD